MTDEYARHVSGEGCAELSTSLSDVPQQVVRGPLAVFGCAGTPTPPSRASLTISFDRAVSAGCGGGGVRYAVVRPEPGSRPCGRVDRRSIALFREAGSVHHSRRCWT